MTTWQPTASLTNLRQRAATLQTIRQFFAERGVLEVETPLLAHATVTDPHLASIQAGTYFLQTSPEFHMKRLLATHQQSIYQLGKAFRADEAGRLHNPEFTLLEWYQIGFDHQQLMDELADLLRLVLGELPSQRFTYAELFQHYLDIDPHTASSEQLQRCAAHIHITPPPQDKDTWLEILMNQVIEPQLTGLTYIYDYPASQAALAKIRPGTPPVAERFEVYINGIELANGFHELTDAHEQRQRMQADQIKRQQHNLPMIALDELFLSALAYGLPACAGVAVGIDRLIMLATTNTQIGDVISFPIQRA